MGRRVLLSALLASAVGCVRGPAVQTATPPATRTVSGITFTVDHGPDGGPVPGVFNDFAGSITFAAGRGRLDITERSKYAGTVVAGIRIATPLGGPGDYYLFDSTGFVLVRPASKTFVSFRLADVSFNFQNRRDGWPDFFQFYSVRVDTLRDGDTTTARWSPRGVISIYWHLDDSRTRGKLTLVDAPASEIAVARWFGMGQALAVLPVARPFVLLTAVAPIETTGMGRLLGPQINLIATHETSAVMSVDVPLTILQLPADFVETSLTPMSSTALSADHGARWKRAPAP